jgi:hypothetical protein
MTRGWKKGRKAHAKRLAANSLLIGVEWEEIGDGYQRWCRGGERKEEATRRKQRTLLFCVCVCVRERKKEKGRERISKKIIIIIIISEGKGV